MSSSILPFRRAIWNYAQRATKMCVPFDPAISLLGLYPQEIIKMGKGPTGTKIFIAALFVVAKNWKSRGCPSIGERLNKLWFIMEYYCTIRNDEQEDFREAWKDLCDLMLSERSRTRRTLFRFLTPSTSPRWHTILYRIYIYIPIEYIFTSRAV